MDPTSLKSHLAITRRNAMQILVAAGVAESLEADVDTSWSIEPLARATSTDAEEKNLFKRRIAVLTLLVNAIDDAYARMRGMTAAQLEAFGRGVSLGQELGNAITIAALGDMYDANQGLTKADTEVRWRREVRTIVTRIRTRDFDRVLQEIKSGIHDDGGCFADVDVPDEFILWRGGDGRPVDKPLTFGALRDFLQRPKKNKLPV